MSEISDYLNDLFSGRKPIRRENPKPGQSGWYYMMPKSDDDYTDYDFIDVPDENTPNPRLQQSIMPKSNSILPQTQLNAKPPASGAISASETQQTNRPMDYGEILKQLVLILNPPPKSPVEVMMSDDFQKGLRTAEQVTTGALDGLSLGWLDEMNGATNALGYGLGSLVPSWNKNGESFSEAMQRGYIEGRDNRRQVLQDGLKENPALVSTAQFIGSAASPINHVNIMGKIPVLTQVGRALNNPMVGGAAAGLGSAEGNWQQQAGGALWGGANGFLSNQAANSISRNVSYSPQSYPNGNLVHNMMQPTFYNLIDKAKISVLNNMNKSKYFDNKF